MQAAIVKPVQFVKVAHYIQRRAKQIRNWTAKIQRIQDQPYLNQARELAQRGDLPAAINAAQPLASSGRRSPVKHKLYR